MGTSLSDQAWGRDSAVFRVTGVLTVVGGWFFTAMMAFTVSSIFATAIFFGRAPVVVGIAGLAVLFVARTHVAHRARERDEQAAEIFNLRKITDSRSAVIVTFEHAGIFLRDVARVLEDGADGLFEQDRHKLKIARRGQGRIQQWSNIIVANVFKVMRLLQREDPANTQRYGYTISALQEISESVRDIVMRAHVHVANNHAGLLEVQIAELSQVRRRVVEILERGSQRLREKEPAQNGEIASTLDDLKRLIHEFDQNQIMRIQDNTSKTRLSILFYAILWDALKIAEQTTHLLGVFEDPLRPVVGLDRPAAGPMHPPTPPGSELFSDRETKQVGN